MVRPRCRRSEERIGNLIPVPTREGRTLPGVSSSISTQTPLRCLILLPRNQNRNTAAAPLLPGTRPWGNITTSAPFCTARAIN